MQKHDSLADQQLEFIKPILQEERDRRGHKVPTVTATR